MVKNMSMHPVAHGMHIFLIFEKMNTSISDTHANHDKVSKGAGRDHTWLFA
jgi:hypothetical protein